MVENTVQALIDYPAFLRSRQAAPQPLPRFDTSVSNPLQRRLHSGSVPNLPVYAMENAQHQQTCNNDYHYRTRSDSLQRRRSMSSHDMNNLISNGNGSITANNRHFYNTISTVQQSPASPPNMSGNGNNGNLAPSAGGNNGYHHQPFPKLIQVSYDKWQLGLK